MRIKALANGNVIEAHPDAAKILIEAKIYEETDEPVTGSDEDLAARSKATVPAEPSQIKAPAPAKGRKPR